MAKPPPPESTKRVFGLDLRSGGLNRPVSAYFSPPAKLQSAGTARQSVELQGEKNGSCELRYVVDCVAMSPYEAAHGEGHIKREDGRGADSDCLVDIHAHTTP